jgi:hypothetical protein
MSDVNHISDPLLLPVEFARLLSARKAGKLKGVKRKYSLNKEARRIIHEKTDGRCHICGCDVPLSKFEADHVKMHSSGGTNNPNNFLPSCKTCNNYRWHYDADEIKWILKLGVWARWHILHESLIGKLMAKGFISKERSRERRRKNPRVVVVEKVRG